MPRYVQTLLFTALFLTAAVVVVAKFRPLLGPVPWERNTMRAFERKWTALREEALRHSRFVLALGDSSVEENRRTPKRLAFESAFNRAAEPSLHLAVLSRAGFGPVYYYLLADEILAVDPVAAILVANLHAFRDSFALGEGYKRPHLAASLRLARVPEALWLPLDTAGLTAAHLVGFPFARVLGLSGTIDKLSRYPALLRETVAARGFQKAHFRPPPERPEDLYPSHLEKSQSTVRILSATVRYLASNGVPTVVLIQPIHVDALRSIGVYDAKDINGAVGLLKQVAIEGGACPLDLSHSLLEEEFSDELTHFTPEGHRIVARLAVAFVSAMLRSRDAASPPDSFQCPSGSPPRPPR